jgi:hypothetical protein
MIAVVRRIVIVVMIIVVRERRTIAAAMTQAGRDRVPRVINAELVGHIVIDRAGMGHFIGNAEFR